ncbi:MAG TPA: aspartyl protease family protein [Candidatus Bathyarchaeia archaeon]|nr:aspartyl protease family protein [Candidatus Bathyarchaeia archaeon]
MRQSGVVDLAKGPRIQVRVTIFPANVTEVVWFLIDTGATFTQVSEGDFLKLGIQRDKLQETDEVIFTAGNVLKQYVYPEHVRLNLVGKNYDFEPMRALLFQGNDPAERKAFLENVNSILGRDIILRHKMTLRRLNVVLES